MILALIPARGGSRRLPDKNLRKLGGVSLLGHAVGAARLSPVVDRVVVSTDSPKVAREARRLGAEVLERPAELATQESSDADVLRHCLDRSAALGTNPDVIIYVRPTAPFRDPALIGNAVSQLTSGGFDSVRSVVEVPPHQHPYWMFTMASGGVARPAVPGVRLSEFHQSQLLPPVYALNGVVDAVTPRAVRGPDAPWGERMGLMPLPPGITLDIDTEKDLRRARNMLRRGAVPRSWLPGLADRP